MVSLCFLVLTLSNASRGDANVLNVGDNFRANGDGGDNVISSGDVDDTNVRDNVGDAGDGRDDNIKSRKGNDENIGIVLVFTALEEKRQDKCWSK